MIRSLLDLELGEKDLTPKGPIVVFDDYRADAPGLDYGEFRLFV